MADTINDLLRLAMLQAWDERCVWCRIPLFFNQTEVEHLMPKSLDAPGKQEEKAQTLSLHGLATDYDLNALENLAPSCRPCNGGKGLRPPPDAPIITLTLERARKKAPGIRETAEKLRSDRKVEAAATVLRAAAEAGHPTAIDALRAAAESVNLAFEQATGSSLSRLHNALGQVLDATTGMVGQSDAFFDYLPTGGRVGGPIHDVAEGSVMSYSQVRGTVETRIDVVPRDAEALARYGPEVTLAPTGDDAGKRAAALLNAALREGREVEITEGIDVTFERLPPAFADQVGQKLSGGTVWLGPVGGEQPRPRLPDWDARIRMTSGTDTASLHVWLRESDSVPVGWDSALSGRNRGVSVTALFRRTERGAQISFTFKHATDRSSATEQAAGMRFLEAVAHGGTMVVKDQGPAKRPPLRMERARSEIPPDALALIALLDDLAVIEEHTGASFTLPDEILAAEVRQIAEVAALLKKGTRSVTWHDAHLNVLEPAVEQIRQSGTMRIEEAASTVIFGLEVELGHLQRDLPAYEVVTVEPLEDQPGTVRIEIQPSTPEAARITEVLVPTRRPATSPPPPPPRKAARKAKRSRRGRRRKNK